MKTRIVVLMLSGWLCLFGQQPRQASQPPQAPQAAQAAPELVALPGNSVTKVVTLKYGNNVSTSILDGIGLVVKKSGNIVAVTGPPDRVETAEAILKQLDVPPAPVPPMPVPAPRKSFQLTAYLIIASRAGAPGASVPAELDSTVKQMTSALSYKSFNLLDAIDLRLVPNSNGGQLKGVLPEMPPGIHGGFYDLDVGSINVWGDELVRIGKFKLDVTIPGTGATTLATDVDMKPGQKIVVGKANIDGSADALIVILTIKVAD